MRHSRPKAKKSDKPTVIEAIRAATNLPPAACMATFRTLVSYANFTNGRNAFVSISTIARQNNLSERAVCEQMAVLRAGKWIEGHEPDDPDAYRKKYPDPLKQARCYRIVLKTLAARRTASPAPSCTGAPPRAHPLRYRAAPSAPPRALPAVDLDIDLQEKKPASRSPQNQPPHPPLAQEDPEAYLTRKEKPQQRNGESPNAYLGRLLKHHRLHGKKS